eukprot:CAMPEP_0206139944 /NCGR_PEP_ID=MMETSP1473-20131121/7822_1 /ASSEMBLY_ACC=CAM_ASM_001109 /TAXON_ID=1461547 /ORGANISM="Stichococcus sp, Strain RCC1054" /LENGTH=270 /DNA_ID=CAMNT_0053533895 /DNA_START=131 /DNA_END=944 /DNA_ORIENTATION=-
MQHLFLAETPEGHASMVIAWCHHLWLTLQCCSAAQVRHNFQEEVVGMEIALPEVRCDWPSSHLVLLGLPISQVEQLCASHISAFQHCDLLYMGRVQWEGALDWAHCAQLVADRERRPHGPITFLNADALDNGHTPLVLRDSHLELQRVARPEIRDVSEAIASFTLSSSSTVSMWPMRLVYTFRFRSLPVKVHGGCPGSSKGSGDPDDEAVLTNALPEVAAPGLAAALDVAASASAPAAALVPAAAVDWLVPLAPLSEARCDAELESCLLI